jgi:hypothetical protein
LLEQARAAVIDGDAALAIELAQAATSLLRTAEAQRQQGPAPVVVSIDAARQRGGGRG